MFVTIITIIGIIVLVVGVYALLTWLTMLSWNVVIPYLFGLGNLSYWQTAGLLFLIVILTGMIKGLISFTYNVKK